MWDVYAFLVTFVACTGYALLRGGAPERAVAAAFVVAVVLSGFAASSDRPFATREIGILVIDIILALVATVVAIRAERFWPIWMAALLGFGVLLQFAYLLGPVEHRKIYQTLTIVNAWPTQILLAIATRRHRLRLKRRGSDKAWSGS